MAHYVCATPTFTTDSFHHDTKFLYSKTTCTVKEGLYSTLSQFNTQLLGRYYMSDYKRLML